MSQNTRAIGKLSILRLLTAVLGVLYSVFMVRYFGATRTIEIYFAAQSVVYLINSLTQSGQLAEIFLPVYVGLKNGNNKENAYKAYSVVVNRMAVFLCLLLLAGFVFAPYFIKLFVPGFDTADQDAATSLFRAFLPLVFLQVQASFLRVVLNAESVFGKAEFAAGMNLIISIVLLVLLYEQLGIWVLLLGLYVGKSLEIMIYSFYAIKRGIRYHLIWQFAQFDHKSFFKTVTSTISYTGATQAYNWALTASLSFLPPGVYAVFQYVQKLCPKIMNVFMQPLNTVIFTRISEHISSEKWRNLKSIMNDAMEIGLFAGFGLFILAASGGKEGLAFLWSGSKFSLNDVDLAYLLLISFFVLAMLEILYGISRKFAVAFGLAKMVYRYQALAQIVSAIVAVAAIRTIGIYGLVMSIVINRFLLLSVPIIISKLRLNEHYSIPGKDLLIKLALTSIGICGTIMWIKSRYFNYEIGAQRPMDLVYGLFWITVAAILTAAVARILKIGPYFRLIEKLKRAYAA